MGTPSLQLLTDRIYQKWSSTAEDTKEETQGDSKRGRSRWATYRWRNNYRGSPLRMKGLSSTSGPPAWGSCMGKTSSQNIWLGKPGDLLLGDLEAVGNVGITLKGCRENLPCSRIQGKSSNWKGAWVRSTYWCRQVSRRSRRQLGLAPGHRHQRRPFWGASSTTETRMLASAILELF